MASNLFAFSTATDSNGGFVRNYRLNYDAGTFDFLGRTMEIFVQLIYVLGIQFWSLPAFWILDFIANPTSLLDPLSAAYGNAVGKLTGIVPPEALALGTFGVLVFYILADRTNNTRSLSDDMSRLGVGMVLSAIVWLMVNNPLAGIKWITDSVSAIIGEFLGAGSPGESAASAYLAPLTQLINYGKVLDPGCSAQWSRAMNSGNTPSCVEVGSASPMDVAAAMIGALVAFISFLFAVYLLLKFVQHFTFAVWSWFALMWVAALAIAKRRAFDGLGKKIAGVVAHLIMLSAVMLIALAGPIALMQALSNIGSEFIFVTLMLMAVGYLALWLMAFIVLRKHGKLSEMLRLNSANFFQKNLGAPSFVGNGSMRGDIGSPLANLGSLGQRYGVPGAGRMQGAGQRIMGGRDGYGGMDDMRGEDYVREATHRPKMSVPPPATATQLPGGNVTPGALDSGQKKKIGWGRKAIITGAGLAGSGAATATGGGAVAAGAAGSVASSVAAKLVGAGGQATSTMTGASPAAGGAVGRGIAGAATGVVSGVSANGGVAGAAKGAATGAARQTVTGGQGAKGVAGSAGHPAPPGVSVSAPAGAPVAGQPVPKIARTENEAAAAMARADSRASGATDAARRVPGTNSGAGLDAEQQERSRAGAELRSRIPVGVSSFRQGAGSFTDGTEAPPPLSGIGTSPEIANSVRESIDLSRVGRERMTLVAASQGVPLHVLMDPDDESGRLRFKVVGGENLVVPAR